MDEFQRNQDQNRRIQLEGLIRNDNKDKFISFLKSQELDSGGAPCIFSETEVLKLICFHRAVGCASALLNGETGMTLDLNVTLEDGLTPLAIAAKSFCYGLTELFLKHGADPSLGGYETREVIPSLPLTVALDTLGNYELMRDVATGESVNKLFSLFWLPELKEPLDTIKLLASRTKQLNMVGVCCVEEYNIVKLAALLLVSWDKLVVDNVTCSSPIEQLITMQFDRESDWKKKGITRSMLDVFRLLECAGNSIEEYRTSSMVKYPDVELEAVIYSDKKGQFPLVLGSKIKDLGVYLQLERLICSDNKEEFVSYLRSKAEDSRGVSYVGGVSYIFSQPDFFSQTKLWKLLCSHRAIGCVSALLNGETGLTVNLNVPLQDCPLEEGPPDGPTPLAIAAESLCFGLTELFLKHGAEPSLCDYEAREDVSSLPLSVALDALCNYKLLRDFRAGESVYKLFSLFWLPELKEPLDTIKLLASKTKQVIMVGVYCVEEWNLVKLAALLSVSWDKLVVDNVTHSSPIGQLIRMQHALESDQGKKEITRSMWDALRLLERSNNFVEQYRTTSMVKHEVVPLEAAYKFLTDVELPAEQKLVLVFSADLDRLAAEPWLGDKVLLGTHLMKKMSPKSMITEHEVVPFEVSYQFLTDLKLEVEQKHVFSADLDRLAAELRLGDKVLLESALMEKMCSSYPMISECIYFTPRSPKTDVEQIRLFSFSGRIPETDVGHFSFSRRLDYAMRLDDRDEFVKLLNGLGSFCSLDSRNKQIETVRWLMFANDSANCAAAVVAGETDGLFNFSDLTDVSWSFLHKAAKLPTPKLTALFLENGFLADYRRDCDELNLQAALPLNVALEKIRTHNLFQGWKDKKSAIDLVVLLCDSDIRELLETVRLLVQKTSNVYFEFLRYLKEGKMIELGALLMVGCKELLPSAFVVQRVVSTSLTHNARVAGPTRHFSTDSGHGNLHEDSDLLERKETLLLIDIFEKIGDYLGAYVRLEQNKRCDQIISEISWLIVRAGISDTQVSKVSDSLPRGLYLAGHQRVLGREYRSVVKQHSGLKLLPTNIFSKQAAPSMLFKQRDRSLHTSVLKVDANLAHFIPAKGLIDLLQHLHSPLRCVSIVAALKKGIRRI